MERTPKPSLRDNYQPPANGAQALTVLRDFAFNYDGETVRQELWAIVSFAMSSPDSEPWTHIDRSNALHLYRHLVRAAEAIPVLIGCYPAGAQSQ